MPLHDVLPPSAVAFCREAASPPPLHAGYAEFFFTPKFLLSAAIFAASLPLR